MNTFKTSFNCLPASPVPKGPRTTLMSQHHTKCFFFTQTVQFTLKIVQKSSIWLIFGYTVRKGKNLGSTFSYLEFRAKDDLKCPGITHNPKPAKTLIITKKSIKTSPKDLVLVKYGQIAFQRLTVYPLWQKKHVFWKCPSITPVMLGHPNKTTLWTFFLTYPVDYKAIIDNSLTNENK